MDVCEQLLVIALPAVRCCISKTSNLCHLASLYACSACTYFCAGGVQHMLDVAWQRFTQQPLATGLPFALHACHSRVWTADEQKLSGGEPLRLDVCATLLPCIGIPGDVAKSRNEGATVRRRCRPIRYPIRFVYWLGPVSFSKLQKSFMARLRPCAKQPRMIHVGYFLWRFSIARLSALVLSNTQPTMRSSSASSLPTCKHARRKLSLRQSLRRWSAAYLIMESTRAGLDSHHGSRCAGEKVGNLACILAHGSAVDDAGKEGPVRRQGHDVVDGGCVDAGLLAPAVGRRVQKIKAVQGWTARGAPWPGWADACGSTTGNSAGRCL